MLNMNDIHMISQASREAGSMPKKRENGAGAVIRYDQSRDRWYTQIMDGYKPDGKPNRINLRGKTQSDVKKQLDEYHAAKLSGEYVPNSAMNMENLFDEWFKHGETVKGWRENTKQNYYQAIKKHLKPAFGKVKVQSLQPRQIQAHVNSLIEKQYKPGGIREIYSAMTGALDLAVRRDIIARSPMDKVDLPPLKQDEIKFLTSEEQAALLLHLPDTTGGRAARFALETGLRVGEICGLQWGDVGEQTISITRTVRYIYRIVDGKREDHQSLVVNPPKTDASKNVLPIGGKAKAILAAQRKAQAVQCMALGQAWNGARAGEADCWVFAADNGHVLNPNNLNRTLANALKAAKLAHRGMHALRHTYLTNAANAGIPLNTLCALARHERASTTADMYLHSDPDSLRQAVNKLDALE
jgi:integrase